MFKGDDKKSKSFQICCPSEMQIASDFILVSFGNIILKFGTYGSLSNTTFENYVRLSDLWHSIDSLISLIFFSSVLQNWIPLNLFKYFEFAAVEFASFRKIKGLKVWTIEIAAVDMALDEITCIPNKDIPWSFIACVNKVSLLWSMNL